VFATVEKRAAEYGVVPIENSTEGAVTHTLDQFTETPLRICAEIYLPIAHSLLARTPRAGLRRVYSHPNVFGQCRRWIQENLSGVDLVPVSSTARAAELAAKEEGSGALASLLAAEIYGIEVLDRDVQDLGGNATRFLVVARASGPPTGCDRTSLVFAVPHRAGALFQALAAFNEHGINLSKIESRPSRTKAWEYYFFVDLEGHAEDAPVRKALEALGTHCTLLTVLGSYPRMAGREG
jgi:chorismate mutase/prephenate dehydratase